MFRFVVLCCAVLLGLTISQAKPQDKYTTKYDSVDIDQILNNERLFSRYVGCLLNDEGCTPDINELKAVLGEALTEECAKCSDVQKEKAEKVFVFAYNNKKDVFDQLAEKYDPNGEHRQHYSRFAEERGIKL